MPGKGLRRLPGIFVLGEVDFCRFPVYQGPQRIKTEMIKEEEGYGNDRV